MIEHIILNAKSHGFTNFTITELSGPYDCRSSGDGSRLGVNVSYVQEEEPLGTAGALSLLENLLNTRSSCPTAMSSPS